MIPFVGLDIKPINIRDINIPTTPRWMTEPSIAVPIYPPVTSEVGIPIVNIPGCIESHEDSDENASLANNDPEQVKIFCDGEMPSFSAINYDARRLQYQTEQKVTGSSSCKVSRRTRVTKTTDFRYTISSKDRSTITRVSYKRTTIKNPHRKNPRG